MQSINRNLDPRKHHPFKRCADAVCPICTKSIAKFKVSENLPDSDFSGSSPAPFVGHHGYPNVNVGVLSLSDISDDVWEYDSPRYWAVNNYQIPQIVNFRSSLINSRFKVDIKKQLKWLNVSREVGMADKPVELDIGLEKKPQFTLNLDTTSAPRGPNAELKRLEITSNPKISSKVEKVYDDTDLKANDALLYLYKNNFDENFLSKVLSVGTVGIKKNRKLVPTRWSITAVDDQLGKSLITKIKDYQPYDYAIFSGDYLGNYFLVICFPDVWTYELFETVVPQSSSANPLYTTDHELYSGRKVYAFETAGGYYASRLPILEMLNAKKRQSSVLVLRFITSDYAIPLGVFVVREAVRNAVQSTPIIFSSKELMIDYVKKFSAKKFGFDAKYLLDNSKLLRNINSQAKLSNYL